MAQWLFDEWGSRRPGASLQRSIERVTARANGDNLPFALLALSTSEEPLATASLVAQDEPEDAFGPWLSGVYTSPRARGHGCATALIHSIGVAAVRLGYSRLMLGTSVPEFYERLGWRATGVERGGELIMERALP